mgnify:CR=1 FL=1
MVVKKKQAKAKMGITHKVREEKEEENEGGLDLDDAFSDDEDVEYGVSKPLKKKKVDAVDDDELDEELDTIQRKVGDLSGSSAPPQVTASKPIGKLVKGDRIIVDGVALTVDAHEVLIDHGSTKEMAIDAFDAKKDIDYQVRYFSDQVEQTIELYQLQEIMYIKKPMATISW